MVIKRRDFLKGALALPFIYSKSSHGFNFKNAAYPHLRSWSKDEIDKYAQWVENIYNFKRDGTSKQKVARINRIMQDDEMNLLNNLDFLEDGNPQCSSSALNIMNSANHCGSFPKLMFLYYAMRRGLPATVSIMKHGRGNDYRYTTGNTIKGQVKSMPFNGDFGDFITQGIKGGANNGINYLTSNNRTAPELEGTDSVPIKIDKEFLKPGTVGYHADGHCLLVGKVDDSGEVHFLDSHPDTSITFNQTLSAIPFVKAASNDNSRCYGGFRNHRLAKLVDGKVIPFSNSEMEEFGMSIEQYEKMAEMRKGRIEINGTKVSSFPQFVRARLKKGKENVFDFLEKSSRELGDMYKERALFVQQGWENVLRNGAITFPNDSSSQNIYQAHGRWETWSSPSSDVDRKNKYNYVIERLEEMVGGFPSNPGFIYEDVGSKGELIDELISRKNNLFGNEIISYAKSNGQKVDLTLSDIEQRLFDLSFNPNHAPELRWGAPEGSKEREGMKLIRTPLLTGGSMSALDSYEAEQGLRYFKDRQATASSLNSADNPREAPFGLLEDRLEALK